ncbi:MAG: sugar-transfer associated ATP-grasp domain-containing protein [Caulobacterales bacterium]
MTTALQRQADLANFRALAARANPDESMVGLIARMAEAAGVPPTRLMRDFAGLSFGPGRVSFSDYARLRLYDEAFWAASDRRSVVGHRRGRELALQANFRHDWFGLASNRVAASAYLATHGLPVAPLEAIFVSELATPSPNLLRTRDELRQFLNQRIGRPLVGQPAEGGGARVIFGDAHIDPATEIDHLIEDVCDNHAGGYLFQPLLAPHAKFGPFVGGHLAAVRLVTLAGGAEPRVFRAVWKLPGRHEYLAQLDLKTGQVLRVTSGSGPDLAEVRAGASLLALTIPDWEAMKATAVEGARLMRHLGLIGWDIAPAEDGPVILKMTPTPDLLPHQLADREGVLDPEFLDFLEGQRQAGAEHAELARTDDGWL